ncbi:MAG: acyl-CoA dehydrogenase, partial [Deltaproteobacteria bacterium]
MRDEAHRFAAEVLRPAGLKLDRMPAEAAAAPDSPLFDVLKKAAALGYTRLRGPTNLGGLQVDPVTSYLIGEELAWGNLGLAAVIALAGVHADLAIASGNTQAIAEFAEPFYGSADGSVIGCWALTEPDHGSDW